MVNNRSKFLVAFMVVGFFFLSLTAVSTASASLSRVGPTLTDGNVKAQTGFMLRHDASVQRFLGISRSKAYELKVEKTKKFRCKIGYSKLCPFNTGKAGTTIVQTSYRRGQVRTAYRVTFTYGGVTKSTTFHGLSSNLLDGAEVVVRPKRRVVTPKKITVNVIKYKAVTDARCDASGSWSVAKVTTSTKKYKVAASSKGWKALLKHQQAAVSGASSSSSAKCDGSAGGAKASCAQMGLIETSLGSGVCQANSASSSQDATVQNDCKGPNVNSSQCVTTINQTSIINQTNINATCSILYMSDGSVVVVEDGSIVQVCSSSNSPPTTHECPPGNTWNGTKCVKNGETTPDPTGPIPGGDNSPPADNESSKCKSHATGLPVDPLPDGRCPVGSYGY